MDRHTATDAVLGSLADLPRTELVRRWRSFYRVDPPKGLTTKLLVRAVAYEMQARRHGGLKPSISRRLLKIAQGDAAGTEIGVRQTTNLKTGARLLRDWNGVTHTVEVTESGFIWNGEAYGSLSSVAHAITGARWSGPRFFGLKT
jgi:hypothetical protein